MNSAECRFKDLGGPRTAHSQCSLISQKMSHEQRKGEPVLTFPRTNNPVSESAKQFTAPQFPPHHFSTNRIHQSPWLMTVQEGKRWRQKYHIPPAINWPGSALERGGADTVRAILESAGPPTAALELLMCPGILPF